MSESPEELEARIAAYIDGELPPAEAARLEVFLANTDPKLARQVISMIADKHALSALPKSKAPSDLTGRIMEQIERGTLLNDVDQFVTPRRPWWQSKAAVAALLLLVFGGFTWFILQAIHTAPTQWQTVVESTSPRKFAGPLSKTQLADAPSPTPSALPESNTSKTSASISGGPLASAEKDAAANNSLASAKRANEPAGFAAAPPTPALPASPSAAAASAPITVLDRFEKSSESSAPVLLTLAAESPDDFTRLHDAIASLSSSNTPSDQIANSDVTSRSFNNRGGGGGSGGRGGFAGSPGSSANSSFKLAQNEQSAAPPMNLAQADDLKGQQQSPVAAASSPNNGTVTYHISLTPAQLTQLTQQFHVKTLSDTTRQKSPSAITTETTQPAPTRDEAKKESPTPATLPTTLPANLLDCTITMTPSADSQSLTSPPSPQSPPPRTLPDSSQTAPDTHSSPTAPPQ